MITKVHSSLEILGRKRTKQSDLWPKMISLDCPNPGVSHAQVISFRL